MNKQQVNDLAISYMEEHIDRTFITTVTAIDEIVYIMADGHVLASYDKPEDHTEYAVTIRMSMAESLLRQKIRNTVLEKGRYEFSVEVSDTTYTASTEALSITIPANPVLLKEAPENFSFTITI